jgi:hypothetical protein
VKTSLAVLAAALVGALAALGGARLIEPSEPPVVPPIELRQEPTQTSEQPSNPGPPPPPQQEADPAPAPPPVRAGDGDDDDDDDADDDTSDDSGESDD